MVEIQLETKAPIIVAGQMNYYYHYYDVTIIIIIITWAECYGNRSGGAYGCEHCLYDIIIIIIIITVADDYVDVFIASPGRTGRIYRHRFLRRCTSLIQ